MRFLLAVAVVCALAAPARADDFGEEQHMTFIEQGADLVVQAKIAKLFDAAAFEAIKSGYATTVEYQLWIFPENSTSPIGYIRFARSAVFDLWDEEFTVRLEGGAKPLVVKYPADALKLLTSLDNVPIAKLVDLPPGDNFELAVRVDLNPVSKETLAEVRRWLTQGQAGGVDRGGALFGSFVSVFVNPKIAEADRVVRVHSQVFYRRKPGDKP
ncbi:MAG TPA: DUF4390 domain-containing protein [Kofleriaceae bacterium]|jgi:hypothetical protein